MPDYSNATQAPLPDLNDDAFMLRNPAEIRAQLISLTRQPDILTAYFNNGKEYLLTAVLGVLDERGLMVLDYGPDETTTRKAIAAGRLVCTTKHQGVPIRFSCEQLKGAKYKGLPAIAAAMPESMHRVQRREYFRVTTPKFNGPRCEICDTEDGVPHELNVVDISAGGLGMLDFSGGLNAEPLQQFENCRLYLPELSDIGTRLVIRSVAQIPQASGGPLIRYGAAFDGMSVADSAEIQRYIFQLQSMQRQ